MSIETEIAKAQPAVFRRAYIKRRDASTGLYESTWFEITPFVKNFGTVRRTIDDLRLNRFTHSGITLQVRNDTGAFNPESNVNSAWFGYMTRYRTLLKIEAGYVTEAGGELPTDPTLGIFLMSDEIPISAVSNSASLRCKSLVSIFDEVRAADVAGLGPTQTASELITRIRDHTDGAGNFYFRQFITSSAWTIQTTTVAYNLATSTAIAIGDMTCWDFMEKLAEAEGFILMINRTGGLEFRDRDERSSVSAFHFKGLGQNKMSVIELQEFKEALNKLYTFFRCKFLEEDTTTSYVTAGSTSVVDPSATTWKYGARVYEFDLNFFNNVTATSAIAQTVVNNLLIEFGVLKEEVTLKTKFIPHLEISDKTLLSYRSADISAQTLWDQFVWDQDNWADESGENFDWDQVAFKVLSVDHDIMSFADVYHLRRI